jgi:hypothetical protein
MDLPASRLPQQMSSMSLAMKDVAKEDERCRGLEKDCKNRESMKQPQAAGANAQRKHHNGEGETWDGQ